MMNSPFFRSNNNCSHPALVFQYGSPMFFTVERSTYRQSNNKRKHSEVEAAEEEPAVHSPSKRTRTTLLSKGRVFLYTPSMMERFNQAPATDLVNSRQNVSHQETTEIESITRRMENLSLAPSQEEKDIESITQHMGSLSLAESQEENIKLITCRFSKLSLAQSQDEEKNKEY